MELPNATDIICKPGSGTLKKNKQNKSKQTKNNSSNDIFINTEKSELSITFHFVCLILLLSTIKNLYILISAVSCK